MMHLSRWMLVPILLLLAQGTQAQIPGLLAKPEPVATKPAESPSIPIADIPQRANEDEVFISGGFQVRIDWVKTKVIRVEFNDSLKLIRDWNA